MGTGAETLARGATATHCSSSRASSCSESGTSAEAGAMSRPPGASARAAPASERGCRVRRVERDAPRRRGSQRQHVGNERERQWAAALRALRRIEREELHALHESDQRIRARAPLAGEHHEPAGLGERRAARLRAGASASLSSRGNGAQSCARELRAAPRSPLRHREPRSAPRTRGSRARPARCAEPPARPRGATSQLSSCGLHAAKRIHELEKHRCAPTTP